MRVSLAAAVALMLSRMLGAQAAGVVPTDPADRAVIKLERSSWRT